MVLLREGCERRWLATIEPMISRSIRAVINSTTSMQNHLNIAVVAAIMVGDGDSKSGSAFSKALF